MQSARRSESIAAASCPFQLVCRTRGYHPAVGDVEHACDYPASLPKVSIGRWTELSLIPKDDVPMDEAAVP